MLPKYINEYLRAYFQMSSEDRRTVLDERYFDLDPLTCPSEYLPYLSLEAGIDIGTLDETTARNMIDKSSRANIYAGTIKSLNESLGVLGDVAVLEKGDFRFDIDFSLNDREITEAIYKKALDIVESRKNVRSVLDELVLSYKQTQNTALATGGVGEVSCMTEVLEGYEETLKGLQNLSIGAVGEASSYAVMEA